MKHDTRTEPSEKAKHPEEEESSGDEGGKAVTSGSEEAQAEGKKKKRSGFRDRKVRGLVGLHLQLLFCREKTCTACVEPGLWSVPVLIFRGTLVFWEPAFSAWYRGLLWGKACLFGKHSTHAL